MTSARAAAWVEEIRRATPVQNRVVHRLIDHITALEWRLGEIRRVAGIEIRDEVEQRVAQLIHIALGDHDGDIP